MSDTRTKATALPQRRKVTALKLERTQGVRPPFGPSPAAFFLLSFPRRRESNFTSGQGISPPLWSVVSVRIQGVVAGALALALAGCTVGPNYVRPDAELPANFSGPEVDSQASEPLPARWWTLFDDAELTRLVDLSLARNTNIQLAVARIEEADAVVRQAGAAMFPEINLGAAAGRSRSSSAATQLPPGAQLIRNDFRVALSTSFELDFWGKLRRAAEAARAQALATRYGKATVELTLAGSVTQSYLGLRSLDAQIGVSRATLNSRQETLALTRKRAAGGVVSDLDVQQAEGARAAITAQLAQLIQQRGLALHQLGVLTGSLDLAVTSREDGLLPVTPVPPVGLPASLIEARPDVRQAEQQLVAANARIGVIKAVLFPSISLTGSFGAESTALSDLTKSPARLWSGLLGLTAPIFDGGRRAAAVDEATAQQRQALALYQQTLQTAFREVSDALTSTVQTAETETALVAQLDAARNALRLAQIRYDAGYTQYLEVLDAQRTANQAELAFIQNRQARLSATVDLIKSLGTGWQL